MENQKKIYYFVPLFVFFIVSFFNNIILSNMYWIKTQDDIWFAGLVSYDSSVWQFLYDRYHRWSSRIFIEYILFNIINLSPYLWAFINSLVMTLIFYSVSKISGIKHILSYFILAVAIFSYSVLPDVGLCCVSVNYIWPLACGLFFLSVLKEICLDNKEVCLLKKICCLILLFFSCNAELMCLFLIIFMFFFIVYRSMNNEKLNGFIFISLSIIIAGLMIHLICPGNYERIFIDAGSFNNYFRKFSQLSFFQTIVYGFISSFLSIKYTWFISVLFFLLLLCGIKLRNKFVFVISIFPIAILLIKSFFINFLPKYEISLFVTGFLSYSNIINFVTPSKQSIFVTGIIVTLIILFFIFFSVEYVLYKYFDKENFYFFNLFLVTAFLIRILFSWTPSIFIGQDRTFVFTNYFVLCADMIIINSLLVNLKTNNIYTKLINLKLE